MQQLSKDLQGMKKEVQEQLRKVAAGIEDIDKEISKLKKKKRDLHDSFLQLGAILAFIGIVEKKVATETPAGGSENSTPSEETSTEEEKKEST